MKQDIKPIKSTVLRMGAVLSIALVLGACSDNDDSSSMDGDDPMAAVSDDSMMALPAAFDVMVTNITAGQPISPILVGLHSDAYKSFSTGSPASVSLENLAESGDNSSLMSDWNAADAVYTTASGNGVIVPGDNETVTLELDQGDLTSSAGLSISVLTMLVNTNDAIAALNSQALASMEVGDSQSFTALTYDSGTEANSETAESIPGPAGGGEGYNATRDDLRDEVYVHAGVVTASDGLATSTLSQIHKWDHPGVRISVTRIQ